MSSLHAISCSSPIMYAPSSYDSICGVINLRHFFTYSAMCSRSMCVMRIPSMPYSGWAAARIAAITISQYPGAPGLLYIKVKSKLDAPDAMRSGISI